MELGVSHEQSLSSSTPVIDNIFDTYNKNLVPIRSLSDHDMSDGDFVQSTPKEELSLDQAVNLGNRESHEFHVIRFGSSITT